MRDGMLPARERVGRYARTAIFQAAGGTGAAPLAEPFCGGVGLDSAAGLGG